MLNHIKNYTILYKITNFYYKILYYAIFIRVTPVYTYRKLNLLNIVYYV